VGSDELQRREVARHELRLGLPDGDGPIAILASVLGLHTDPQHASMFDVLPLLPWTLDPECQKLLACIKRVQPLKKASLLSSPDTRRKLCELRPRAHRQAAQARNP